MITLLRTPFILICTFLVISSCAVNPVTGKKELMLLSEQQEIQLGRESDPAIVAAYGLYENDQLQNFINEEGQKMAKISHRPQLDYHFKILDSPVVNAFALPGGYIYFTRGILAHFNNEAEFAGVLGHEIGHVTARHSASQYSKQMLFQVGFIAGLIISPEFATFSDVAQQGLGLLFLKYSRDNESQSDQLGVEYSTRIGYDAHNMANFFETLDQMRGDEGGQLPTFLSTHPDPRDRQERVAILATQWQQELNVTDLMTNRESYLQMIDGLVYGNDPRQGFHENNAFYHPVLKFQFPVPVDWRVANSPSQVQMAPQSGKALMIFTLADEPTLEAAVQATIQENQLQVLNQSTTVVNGFNALAMVSDQQNPQNPESVIRIMSYFIRDGDYIYEFHGLALKPDYQTYAALFANTMKGYERLTDPDKLNRQPERIRVVKVQNTGPLTSAFATNGVPQDRYEEMALLNGLDLNSTAIAGSSIKVLGQ